MIAIRMLASFKLANGFEKIVPELRRRESGAPNAQGGPDFGFSFLIIRLFPDKNFRLWRDNSRSIRPDAEIVYYSGYNLHLRRARMSNPTPNLPTPPQGNVIRQTILRARLVWRLMRDPRVLWLIKLIPFSSLIYLLFPTDIIIDVIPILGQLDDMGVILASLWLFVELCPSDIVKEHWDDLTAVHVKGTWKDTEQEKLPGPAGESADKPK
jgi:uncharacterized membrane protein YkvA (DUF1232 family)